MTMIVRSRIFILSFFTCKNFINNQLLSFYVYEGKWYIYIYIHIYIYIYIYIMVNRYVGRKTQEN